MTLTPHDYNKMLDSMLTKPCAICGKRITGPGFFCPVCKLILCFYCGIKMTLAEGKMDVPCPACGSKLL